MLSAINQSVKVNKFFVRNHKEKVKQLIQNPKSKILVLTISNDIAIIIIDRFMI